MAKKYTGSKVSATDKINNQILSIISSGVNPWVRGWNLKDGMIPFNAESGRAYKGLLNSMLCSLKADGRLPAFTTANRKAGRFPVKGSKSVQLIRPIIKKEMKNGKEVEKFCGIGYTTVFSIYDIQGYDVESCEKKYAPKDTGEKLEFTPIESCERIVADMPNRPKLSHGGNSAYYRPSTDAVQMPKRDMFKCNEEYYHTLFHELAHSTMHVSRLDRKQAREGLETQKHEYSFEELVAELTACYTGSEVGILNDSIINNSASYLNGWIKPLQNNPDWIIKASSQAAKAHKYITGKHEAPKA